MKMHPDLKKPSQIKRIPSSTVVYEKEIHPPLTDDITKLQELIMQTLIGRQVSKRFSAGIYLGTVTSTWTDDNHHGVVWLILTFWVKRAIPRDKENSLRIEYKIIPSS
jgi:hypothetical protein